MCHWVEHNGERMCDGPRHARQCGIMISRNVPLPGQPLGARFAQQTMRGGAQACPQPGRVLRSNVPRGGNPEVREKMKANASKWRRFGYRQIGGLLERKGMIMNITRQCMFTCMRGHKKLYRLYTEETLAVGKRRCRKRARGSRPPMPVALRPGERWSVDFVSDTFGASIARQWFACNP